MANSLDFRVKKGLVVATTATIQSSTNSTSTLTGALVVTGGVGIGRDLYVGGTIYGAHTGVSTTATNATNIIGGAPGFIHIQSASGVTSFISTGSVGQLLQMQAGNTATWVSTGSLVAGIATSATNITGGVAGSIHIQSAPGVTTFINTGSVGSVLQMQVGNTSSFVSTSSLQVGYANTATTSTFAAQLNTILQAANATYYPTFVDSNNATATSELVYTTSSFSINPMTGKVIVTAPDIDGGLTLLSGAAGSQTSFGVGRTAREASFAIAANASNYMVGTVAGDAILMNRGGNLFLGMDSGYAVKILTGNVERLRIDATGVTYIYTSTNATSTATGALTIAGGVGIGRDMWVGGTATIQSTLASTSSVSQNALYVAGGVGIAKTLLVTGEAVFLNNVTFSGTSTYVYSTNTVYTDNLINIHVPIGSTGSNHSWSVDDGKDIGFIYHYYSATDKDAFLGLANDSKYLEWYNNGTESGGIFTGTSYGTFKTGGIILVNTTATNSTNTGALTVAGGVGIGGGLFVGGTVTATTFVGAFAGTVTGTASNASQVNTILQTANASYFPTFVDSNNAAATAETVYTTSSFTINPLTGNVGHGTASPAAALHVVGSESRFGGVASGYISVYNASTRSGYIQANGGTDLRIAADTDPMTFYVNGSERKRIDTWGNVAIGKTGPYNTTTDVLTVLRLQNATSRILVDNQNTNTSAAAAITLSAYGGDTQLSVPASWPTTGLNPLVITVNATERLRITSAGAIAFSGSTNYGNSGDVLKSNGNAAPTWVAPSTLASGSATNADNIKTILQTASASYYPTFVDSNNATATAELVYTTSSFYINPFNGAIQLNGTGGFSLGQPTPIAFANGQYIKDNGGGGLVLYSGSAMNLNAVGGVTLSPTATSYAQQSSSLLSVNGYIYATEYLMSAASSQQASGAKIQRVYSTAAAAGSIYPLGTWYDTEGAVALEIQVSSETSANSGSATYRWQGGFDQVAAVGTYYRLLPFNEGRGHGDGADTGLNLNAWGVYVYKTDGYTYGIAVSVPAGRTAKTLVTTISELKRGMTYVAGFNTATTVWTTGTSVYSHKNLIVENLVTATTGYFNGTVTANSFVGAFSGAVTGASTQVQTVLQTASANYYPTFVSANNASATAMSVYTTSSFVINPQTGYHGIGTSAPRAKLDVADGNPNVNGDALTIVGITGPTAGIGTGLLTIQSNNSFAADKGGSIAFGGRYGSAFYGITTGANWAYINGYKETATDGSLAGYLQFQTRNAAGTITERLRITSLGYVGVGYTSTQRGETLGVLGGAYVSGTVTATTFVGAFTGAVTGASTQVQTTLQTGNASYFPTFVDTNNASATGELVYTTSSFSINPSTGNVSIGTTVAPGANGRGITIYTSDYPRLSFRNSTTGDATTDGSQLLVSGSDFYIQNQEAGALIFNTTSIERMRITAGGYIGIGNIASPGTLLSNTATRHGNADGLSAHLNAKQWEVNGQGYSSVVSNISAASANVNGGLLVKLGSTDVTDKILDLESGGVNRVRVLGNGNVGIGTGATAPAYKLEVNGSFAATTKSFVIDHPTKPGMKLRYGSLEGPENGVYVRGKLTGTNTIDLPEYWTKLVDPDSITVSLTSIGKHQDLYVADIANNVVTVGNGNLLSKAINCFYVVYGERCDVDKLVVEI